MPHASRTGRSRRRRGFTLLELTVVLAILTVALGMFVQTLASSSRVDPAAAEVSRAAEYARMHIERMHAVPFDEVYARWNRDPLDDPGGPATAPGDGFDVPGLAPVDVEGRVGAIEFPGDGVELREDAIAADLGMPRDLDGDGVVDALDKSDAHVLLPVRVRVEWSSKGARRAFVLHTIFFDR